MGQPSSRWAHDSGLSDVRKVRFCTVPTGARIAYASAGSGSALLVPAVWNSHLELLWQDPFAALRSGRLWLVLAACATTTGGVVSALSFISPLLTDRAGGLVPLVLVGFGVGSLIGTVYGGRLGDVLPHATTVVVAAETMVVLNAICLLSPYAVPTVVLVALLGLIGISANLVLSSLAVRFAGVARTLGVSMSVAAYNLGTAVGSWIAGLTLGSALGATGPAVVGTVIASLTLVPAIAIAIAIAAARPPALHGPVTGGRLGALPP